MKTIYEHLKTRTFRVIVYALIAISMVGGVVTATLKVTSGNASKPGDVSAGVCIFFFAAFALTMYLVTLLRCEIYRP